MKTYEDYTVAAICAIGFEMSAVRFMLDGDEHPGLPRQPGDPNQYILGQMSGHNVVLAWLPAIQGKSAAAVVATNLQRTFPSLQWRFMVGIGGGVPSVDRDIRLGDVVVSMPDGLHGGVVQYDLGKDTDSGFILKGFLKAPLSHMRAAVVKMQSDHLVADNKVEEFVSALLQRHRRLQVYQRPPAETDVLFDDTDDGPQICMRPARQSSGPEIHYGLIASGDRVMRSSIKRSSEVNNIGDILCFEMEAAGLATEFSCIVIRGISDYADSHKNDTWQHYAAAAAAACTKELLAYIEPTASEDAVTDTKSPTGVEDQSTVYSSFVGRGIHNAGSGNFSVGGNVHIS
ncbi:uncharacterized protein JN550_005473 [Neoarthrinium moseri]|uniref:uncharacterized protein n=1 Tax=Neoarthrinium moseri TaxID=1658444 RepID=UPI001FDBAE0C|nr:uncharacterized protein JN550_005473 [Neoarthrinium moseri]KAI1869883.1 hypothetical protein JN550_005473 [Neoarthrinium moseri]